jgi:hypothetical protein
MRVNVAIPEAQVTAPVLDAALEAVTRLNEQLIKDGHPTFTQALPGVKWKPEPPGQEHFDHAGIVAHRGHGDCDDLAPWHAASLRATGQDPGALAVVKPSGPSTWHAVVQRSDGSIDDPSQAAGMGRAQHGVHGAWLPLMNPPQESSVSGAYSIAPRPQLALRPARQGWQARVDLPWHYRQDHSAPLSPTDYALAALHTAPTAPLAIVGALDGACLLGDCAGIANPDHVERMKCFADCAEGMPFEDLCRLYGHEHATAAGQVIGSFWGSLAHAFTAPVQAAAHFVQHPSLRNLGHVFTDPVQAAMHAAQPLAHALHPMQGLFRMIPGVGPVAATALDIVDHGLPTSFKDFGQMALRNAPGFIPGVGPALSMAQQFMPHLPTSPGDLAQMAIHAAPGFIPGVGPALRMAEQYGPMAAQMLQHPQQAAQEFGQRAFSQAAQHYMPQGWPQMGRFA